MPEHRIVRHPNGHLMVEECPLPTKADFDAAFRSISKAWPVLAQHASHIDGEFDNAVADLRRMTERLLGAATSVTGIMADPTSHITTER